MKSLLSQVMSSICRLLRNHIHFVLVVGVLLVGMTWPTIVYVFDTDVFWLPTVVRDVWMRIWDAWYAARVVAGSSAAHWTETLFYAVGMSLDYHPSNMFHVVLLSLLGSVVPVTSAFNCIFLLIILASTVSTYLYLRVLFRDKRVSLFGAVIVGFSQFIVGNAQNPDLNMLVTLPLSLLALHRAVFLRSWTWTAISGILLGVTAYVGMYILVCAMITVAVTIAYFALAHWRDRRFWLQMALLLCLAAIITFPRVYPMIRDSDRFSHALDKTSGKEEGHDLLASFVNYHHPALTPMFYAVFGIDETIDAKTGEREVHGFSYSSYLGYLPLFLVALGLIKTRYRRKSLPWLFLFLLFFSLRLGSFLRVNDVKFVDIHLPKHYLDQLLPPVFQAFNVTEYFMVGMLLPLAILSCYGLRVVLKSFQPRYHALVIIIAIATVAFEYYQVPRSMEFTGNEFAFNNWLLGESNSEQIRLVNLPMGRQQSKIYGFYQSLNSFPHAEGLAMRTPLDAYNFIRENDLLATWQNNRNVTCHTDSSKKYLSAAQDLLDQGFSHIVHHFSEYRADRIADSLSDLTPAYRDEYVAIYRIQALHDACADKIARFQDTLPHLKTFLFSPANLPKSNESFIILHAGDAIDAEAQRYYAKEVSEWGALFLISYDEAGELTVTLSDSQTVDIEDIATANRIFRLVSNPQYSNRARDHQFVDWLSQYLVQCKQADLGDSTTVRMLVDRRFPCALIDSTDSLMLRYEGGIVLNSLISEIHDEQILFYFWWNRNNVRGHAFSVQLFDKMGNKVTQADHVITVEPLLRIEIDISALEAGEYLAKLIVYDSATKQSQSGTIVQNQQWFRRELEIANFSVDA